MRSGGGAVPKTRLSERCQCSPTEGGKQTAGSAQGMAHACWSPTSSVKPSLTQAAPSALQDLHSPSTPPTPRTIAAWQLVGL